MISIKIRQGKSGKDTGCYHNGTGQFQVVIGNHVKDAYQYVMELVTIDENAAVTGGKKPNLFDWSTLFQAFLRLSFTRWRRAVSFKVFWEYSQHA